MTNKLPEIRLEDYFFELPTERIAKFPKEKRDESKLLYYQNGNIEHRIFKEVTDILTPDHQLFFNNTKVLPARLFFKKETGALIEIFLFNPVLPSADITSAMVAESGAVWSCTIGNLKRWKDTPLVTELDVDGIPTIFTATLVDREKKLVKFEWNKPQFKFVDIVSAAGETPLPPYLKREATVEDRSTYQTVYSKKEGAVAAPTAGLHFTEEVIDTLKQKGVKTNELTLHVSAGTFKPISVDNVVEHDMHNEQVIVTKENLEALIESEKVAAVGTTSMRTLESLYWFGVRLMKDKDAKFDIQKLEPYQQEGVLPTRKESFTTILNIMNEKGLDELNGETSIFIMPGYQFKVVDTLITNFHLPSTTLVLLIAAFVGEDWRKIYNQALDNDYRFLSYGDSSILFRN
ncbi:S-adenosylmethionine:tRNA ribosyltransferase-isomerase [Limibacter armeniacum]|uniref:S-adenosylmethionine:tRNA ribosyltransferase-isomerase n=1 Tax=Limibacter armeniacum TaxID=466084 RepID=UPI002FE6A4F3